MSCNRCANQSKDAMAGAGVPPSQSGAVYASGDGGDAPGSIHPPYPVEAMWEFEIDQAAAAEGRQRCPSCGAWMSGEVCNNPRCIGTAVAEYDKIPGIYERYEADEGYMLRKYDDGRVTRVSSKTMEEEEIRGGEEREAIIALFGAETRPEDAEGIELHQGRALGFRGELAHDRGKGHSLVVMYCGHRMLWERQWPNHCKTCEGHGVFTGTTKVDFGPGGLPDADPCHDCTEKGICARCGEPGLDRETGEGPCTNCGWNYDDAAPEPE